MSRVFHIPGIFFLFCAFVLSLLAAISLPFLPALDVARANFTGALPSNDLSVPMSELRLGVWASCSYSTDEDRTCQKGGLAYNVSFTSPGSIKPAVVTASWTRGLVLLPLAAVVTFIALGLSFSQHILVTLIASLVSFFAALLLLIAFAIQIALFARLKNLVGDLDIDGTVKPGVGFWFTFASLILTLLAGCTVCFGRRRDQAHTRSASAIPSEKVANQRAPAPSFFSRFRKN